MRGEEYMNKLEGKIALITGGNSGIGLATAKQFVNEGAYVFITGRREPELARAVKEIGRNVTGVQGDVASLGDLDRLLAQIKREKGKLDIVFANAGVAGYPPFGILRRRRWKNDVSTHLDGVAAHGLPVLETHANITTNVKGRTP
jgi:NAD(P)-dependent dehydrogenase (short-subunit alcohol dehydrogenase family)